MRRGSLVVVGTGIESMGQMTDAARRELRRADRVLYVVADPLTERAVRALNRRSESLHGLYGRGTHRLITYARMARQVLEHVRQGERVCFALYGHPGVFAMPAHAAVRLARQEGFPARMLPAVSADACLIADLGVDPAAGWQSYEATDFLLRRRRADPTAALVLWQVGVIGRLDYPDGRSSRAPLKVLSATLSRLYPRGHRGILYEAATLPGFPPDVREVRLSALDREPVSSTTTLYVPPAQKARVDRAMQARLGLGKAPRASCLR
jgi:uncharacterized protein YabN with tetrapyrrole methylase and pyrophosphatase domain